MTDQDKELFRKAVDQISVPKNEVQRALARGLQAAPAAKPRRAGLWVEISVTLAAVASILILVRVTMLKPETSKPNDLLTTVSSTVTEPMISRGELSAYNWRTADETFYSFSVGEVQVKALNQESVFYGYTIVGDTLQLFDSTETVQYSYTLTKEGQAITLTPVEDESEKIVLEPIIVKRYTQADVDALETETAPDLTAHEWMLEGDDDEAFSILTFDAAILKNTLDDNDTVIFGTYTVNGNEIQITYDAIGGLHSSYHIYRDGDRLVFWPSDANDHKEERQMVLEPRK
ncbi:hypothetical protein [Enterococcus larvae]|uniref:hypothetical protein n=1 Tax=Enterococcus larvae TaxID=2794352 RepID=UPI003F37F011